MQYILCLCLLLNIVFARFEKFTDLAELQGRVPNVRYLLFLRLRQLVKEARTDSWEKYLVPRARAFTPCRLSLAFPRFKTRNFHIRLDFDRVKRFCMWLAFTI